MKLYLLPVSTRRTLIYCQRINVQLSEQQSRLDQLTARAAKLWASWEEKNGGWQKKVVEFGNKAMKRIPYEEWGLKSIPPISARRKEEELVNNERVELSFPKALIPESKVLEVLKTLGTERQGLHKTRMIYCFIGMPISAPIALLPVIPNLPFFYLVYRAWSHWRALSGSKHIQYLLENNLVDVKPSVILDTLYSAGIARAEQGGKLVSPTSTLSAAKNVSKSSSIGVKEVLVISPKDSPLIAKALEVPELHAELDRAIWQVETDLSTKKATDLEDLKLKDGASQAKVEGGKERKS